MDVLLQGKDVPNWFLLLHLFPKTTNPELHAAIQDALFDFGRGFILPRSIHYYKDGKTRSCHVSGYGSIAMKTIDYWTEKLGDVEIHLASSRRLSPQFHGMMYKMRTILRRKLWNV